MTAAVKFAARPLPLNGTGLPSESYRLWVNGELVEWDACTGEVRTLIDAQANGLLDLAGLPVKQLASAR